MGSSAMVSTNVGAALTWKRVKASGSITHDTRRVSISSPTAARVWRIDWALSPPAMVITAIAAVAVLASHCAHARDLGVIGPVYAIAEPSLLEVIQTKLRQMQANGDLSRLQRESQARIQREVEQPAPVPGITKTTRARVSTRQPHSSGSDSISLLTSPPKAATRWIAMARSVSLVSRLTSIAATWLSLRR